MAQAVGAGLPDFITVATAADGKLMTKVFFVDRDGEEQTLSYDKGYLFNFFTRAAACLDDLVGVLDGLDRHSCVIYGRVIEGISMPCRRLLNSDQKDRASGDHRGCGAFMDPARHRQARDRGRAFRPGGRTRARGRIY